MHTILVTGATGMLGHQVIRALSEEGHRVVALTRRNISELPSPTARVLADVPVLACDLRTDELDSRLDEVDPDVVINCAGAIKQRLGDWTRRDVLLLNALVPHHLASWCENRGRRLIHVSTDCVFRGDQSVRPYRESDRPDASDLYGYSKAAGEVRTLGSSLTLRTSIIGRELETHNGLLEWFLSQPAESKLRGYENHWWSGVTTVELARLIRAVIRDAPTLHGLYQVATDPINKHDLLCLMSRIFGTHPDITRFQTDRDVYRVLDGSLLREEFGYSPPAIETQLETLCSQESTY